MGTMRVDDIQNSAGTGAPTFSKGIDLSSTGGFNKFLTSAKSADYTVTDTDNINVILMTTSSTDRTVTLPTAADNAGRKITVKKVDSGSGKCTLDGEGSETVDGSTTYDLLYQYDSITLICDGTEWHNLSKDEQVVGTYTPALGGDASGEAYGAQVGNYVSRGKIVYVNFHINLSTAPTGGTNILWTVLPFTAANTDRVAWIQVPTYVTCLGGTYTYGNYLRAATDGVASTDMFLWNNSASVRNNFAHYSTGSLSGNFFYIRA